jgi:hypothetical protein
LLCLAQKARAEEGYLMRLFVFLVFCTGCVGTVIDESGVDSASDPEPKPPLVVLAPECKVSKYIKYEPCAPEGWTCHHSTDLCFCCSE